MGSNSSKPKPYKLEEVACYISDVQQNGLIPLHRYYNGKNHFYTTNYNELGGGKMGYRYERIAGYVSPKKQRNMVPLFRYCNGTEHFYSTNPRETNGNYEGIACYVFTSQSSNISSVVPLYRCYNGKDHFYTTNESEFGGAMGGCAHNKDVNPCSKNWSIAIHYKDGRQPHMLQNKLVTRNGNHLVIDGQIIISKWNHDKIKIQNVNNHTWIAWMNDIISSSDNINDIGIHCPNKQEAQRWIDIFE